jgi:hypothetical protein
VAAGDVGLELPFLVVGEWDRVRVVPDSNLDERVARVALELASPVAEHRVDHSPGDLIQSDRLDVLDLLLGYELIG